MSVLVALDTYQDLRLLSHALDLIRGIARSEATKQYMNSLGYLPCCFGLLHQPPYNNEDME